MNSPASSRSVVRAYLAPAILLFLVPAFGLWFAGHAEGHYDDLFLGQLETQFQADPELTAEQRAEAVTSYRAMPPSLACASTDPGLQEYRQGLGEACDDYRWFGWLRLLSLASIFLGVFSALVIAGSSTAAHLSRNLQYPSLLVGWNTLKVAGALQTLLQGTIAVLLSFWMTAVWFEQYYVKLILMIGAVAALAAFNVVVAIFRKPPSGLDVEGEPILEEAAPELWARIRQLCTQLGTEPPRQVIAGIDDNFFVTEGEVRVGEQKFTGRTLYVSLSLLRTMKRSEADAVLAHEMAHFSGGDTAHSKKLAPLRVRFGQYLQALYEGVITRPIFRFMNAYQGLFTLALAKTQRSRELEADATAARSTSAQDVARALVKVGAYASYRGRVEQELFEKNEQHTQLGIADRVAQGFQGYATSEAVQFDLHQAVTPHPFDSHPRLTERLEGVGVTFAADEYQAVLLDRPASSWVSAITGGDEVERRLWAAYEAQFNSSHDLVLAYRYGPDNETERAHVEKYFPVLTFSSKDGKLSVELDHQQLTCSEWDAPLPFGQISGATVEERLFKKYLELKPVGAGMFGGKKSLCLSRFPGPDEVLEAFNRYYGRHQVMVKYREENAPQAAPSAVA